MSVVCWRPLCEDCMEEIAVSDPNDERLIGNEGGEDE